MDGFWEYYILSHFAQLDANNKVLSVVVVHDNDSPTEAAGIAFLTGWSNGWQRWKQTSYNGSIRKNFAGIGYQYDEARDAFIAPKPFPSWVLDEATCQWEAPTPMPQDGEMYQWDEQTTTWRAL